MVHPYLVKLLLSMPTNGRLNLHEIAIMLKFAYRFISYPRTETNMFPKELDLAALVRHQTEDPIWGGKILLLGL